jgi:pimeloyl-ACP methyl ester carboxylesterase
MTYLLYALLAYLLIQQLWVAWMLITNPAPRLLASDQNKLRGTGLTFSETTEKDACFVTHTVEDGIERIVYTPKNCRHETPILMLHGMWHGAWCWGAWQEILAEQGWESIAFSLPGHGKSPTQRPLTACTLSYYLAFLRDEINRLPRKPVLMGHSMGGALSQWYLRHVEQGLPAVVLVAPWVSHSVMADGGLMLVKLDPLGMLMMFATWNASSWMRSPYHAAQKLITPGALLSPEELHRNLVGESGLVTYQHNPPFWHPAENLKTPMLVLAGEKDAVVSVEGLRKTAAHYKAEFVIVPNSGHNLMMEKTYRETVLKVSGWLGKQE